ncbi:MAG: riboflavin synthase [Phycisphaerae bacterium]|nr:riboflavin synthase [Phycisphaerae bacterium]
MDDLNPEWAPKVKEIAPYSLQVFMFTGLIESVGVIRSIQRHGNSAALSVELGTLAEAMQLGDSVAVNGVCLTVTRLTNTLGSFDVSQETLDRTTIGSLRPGAKANLERALQVGSRLGGHWVQGHVDGLGHISMIKQAQAFMRISVDVPHDLSVQIVPKGSIAVNGISLTVADRDTQGFSIAVIPETLRGTTLTSAKVGDAVNLETDIIVKSVQQYLSHMVAGDPRHAGMTLNRLKQLGF